MLRVVRVGKVSMQKLTEGVHRVKGAARFFVRILRFLLVSTQHHVRVATGITSSCHIARHPRTPTNPSASEWTPTATGHAKRHGAQYHKTMPSRNMMPRACYEIVKKRSSVSHCLMRRFDLSNSNCPRRMPSPTIVPSGCRATRVIH
jgi:hypothetical protein